MPNETVATVIVRMKDEASAPAKQVANSVREVGNASSDASKKAKDFGDSAGKVGESAGKMAGALSLVSPAAGEVSRTLADLADVGEVLAQGVESKLFPTFSKWASSLSGLVPVLGGALSGAMVAAAAAAAPLAGHMAVLWREEEEAAARAQFLADHLHDLDSAMRALEDAQLAALAATGKLTEAQAEQAAIQDKATRAVADFEAAQEKERQAANESYYAAEKRLRQLEMLPDFLSTAINYYGGYTSAQQEALGTLRNLDQIEGEHQTVVAETAEAERKAAEATRKKAEADKAAAEATKRKAEAEREAAERARLVQSASDIAARAYDEEGQAAYEYQKQVEALKDEAARLKVPLTELQPALDQLQHEFEETVQAAKLAEALKDAAQWAEAEFAPAVDEAAGFLGEFQTALAEFIPDEALADVDKLAGLQADLALAFARGAIDLDTYNAQMERLASATQAVADAEADRAVASAASTVSDVASGPSAVMSAVSSAGPWGALIAAIVELVGNLADVGDMFNEFTINVNNSIAALPETLAENLDTWLTTGTQSAIDMVPDLVKSLAENLDDIIGTLIGDALSMTGELVSALFSELPGALFDLLGSLFSSDFWSTVGGTIAEGFMDLIGTLGGMFTDDSGEATGESVLRGLDSVFLGGLVSQVGEWTGAFDTGTDYVHKTGLALVHQGERIIPTSGASSGRSAAIMGGGGGGGVNVYLPPGLMFGSPDQLAREMARHFGSANRGLALPTGSVR